MIRRLAALGACVFLSVALAAPARADSGPQKLATAKKMIKAWQALDWAQVYDLFAEDGVLHSMMDEPVKGRAAIRERLGKLAPGIERIELQVERMGVIDGRVFIERVDDFVYKGHHGRVPVVGVMEIENGRITAWREYYDRAQLLREMGVGTADPHAKTPALRPDAPPAQAASPAEASEATPVRTAATP